MQPQAAARKLKAAAAATAALGACSFFALALAYLALTDIWHGEADVSLEWRVVQIAFPVMLAFHAAAFVTFVRLIRFVRG